MTLIAEPNAARIAELRAAVGRDATELPSLEAVRDALEKNADHDAVVLGPSIESEGAFRLASDYQVTRPGLSVILVRRRVEASLLASAMRHGVRDVVEERDLTALNQAVARARGLAAELRMVGEAGATAVGRKRGTVITVFSAKGGCGKTTVATNLAAMAAAERHESVCLVDLDLSFGDVGIALQLVPDRTIADAVAMASRLDAEGLEGLLTRHPSGLRVLAAPVGPDVKENINPDLVTRIIDVLVSAFDVVILDTPPAFDDTTLAAFDRTNVLLVLTTPDVPAVKNLKLSLETLHLIGFPSEHIKMVVNRADSRVGLSASDIEKAVRVPAAARIPSSRDVPTAVNRGETIALENPKHPVSQAFRALLDDVLPSGPAEAVPPSPRSVGRRLRRSKENRQ